VEMRIPNWIRIIVLVSAVMQLVFGLTVLVDPGQIKTVWPWPLPHLSARLLGASTLVSVPMAILSVRINRFVVAAIPFAMMMTYRVLQLAAGLIHLDRFDLATPLSLNYFGGGFMMLLLFGYVLWAGLTRRLPVASESAPFAAREPWKPGKAFRWTFGIVALVYTVLGVAFLLLGKNAAPFWIDAAGMTPLTARLFSSPLIGLGLGLFLVSRALDWRSVFVPAIGIVTIGVTGTLAMIIERKDLVAANAIAVIVILTPVVLLTIGCVILLLRPKQYTRRGQESL
jgi:hypothetical protein